MKIDKHIEIVSSSNPALSSMGQKSRDAAFSVLSQHYKKVGVTIVDDISDLQALVSRKPDLVFLGMKFIPRNTEKGFQDSDKIWISKYLDDHGIMYTGSNQNAHELELLKPLAKERLISHGLATSPYYVVKQHQLLKPADNTLKYPLFVKPTDRGGGLGIDSYSVVNNFEQLCSKVNYITTHIKSDSLVEQYLPGREISVAILRRKKLNQYFVMPIERIVPADKNGVRILSPDLKHADAGLSVAVTDTVVKNKVTTLALQAFQALGARDFGRIDIRLDERGIPNFLEANLIPSLIEGYGNFPKACMLNVQLGYEDMIIKITELAFMRSATHGNHTALEEERATQSTTVFVPVFDR